MRDTFQDPAAYLQRRVALFSGVASATFAVGFVVDLTAGSAEGEPVFSSTRVAFLAVSLSCAAIWLVTRRGELRPWQSRALELFGMGVATSVFATLPIHPPIPGAGGVMGLMAPEPLPLISCQVWPASVLLTTPLPVLELARSLPALSKVRVPVPRIIPGCVGAVGSKLAASVSSELAA